ncbi:MAG: NAD-dependent epimerase [Planctomycetaceae bacterium]
MSKYLVTGAAGFIGFHTAKKLLEQGHEVVGLDCVNDYYDVTLKEARIEQLEGEANYRLERLTLEELGPLMDLHKSEKFDCVINLAAQAGVRYSIENPHAYVTSNLVGFVNILEACRHTDVGHLVYASSSSVYGSNRKIPFATEDSVDHPISLYAATKKSNELMAHTYSHLYDLPTTGLRFFTVYGPWGRPDMALFLFTKAILEGKPIQVFNHGKMRRDFTYIDDIVEGIIRTSQSVPESRPDLPEDKVTPSNSQAPYKVYNIGNNEPVELMRMIEVIEESLGQKAEKIMMDMQPGDVPQTYADIDALMNDVGFKPATPIEVGIKNFVDWYREFYNA